METSRKFVASIKNYSFLTLERPKVCCVSGKSPFEFPTTPVQNNKGLVWGACKTDYSTKGTSGVVVYHIKDYNLSLAFMWSVPYLFYSNWWNIKIYEGLIEPDEGNNCPSFVYLKLSSQYLSLCYWSRFLHEN